MGNKKRHIRVRGIRKEQPDIRRLARAIIELAQAQAEADAQAESQRAGRSVSDSATADGEHDSKTDQATSFPPEDRQ